MLFEEIDLKVCAINQQINNAYRVSISANLHRTELQPVPISIEVCRSDKRQVNAQVSMS